MKIIKTPSFKLATMSRGSEKAKKLALVLPGRLDTKDYVHMTSHVDYLAGLGYYAVSFDPPYSWDSPGAIENYTTTNYIKAVNEVIKYFGNRPTFIVGHSRGGAVAQLASSNSFVEAIALVMSSYGAPSPPDPKQIKNNFLIEYRDLPPGNTRTAEQKEFHTPLNYFEDAAKFNPAEALRNFERPKLMICGTQDQFIKSERVEEIYNSLRGPKMFLELDTEHDYRLRRDIIKRVNEAVEEFLEQYLKGDT